MKTTRTKKKKKKKTVTENAWPKSVWRGDNPHSSLRQVNPDKRSKFRKEQEGRYIIPGQENDTEKKRASNETREQVRKKERKEKKNKLFS